MINKTHIRVGAILLGLLSTPFMPSLALSQESCSSMNSPKEVLGCALSNHPKIRRAQAFHSQSEEQPGAAGQWINPELDTKAVTGNSLGDRIIEAEVSLTQTLELGGKRGAKKEMALAELSASRASLKQAQEEVALDTITGLYRMRQIQAELEIVEEALHTFATIRTQFRSRPRLTPDQQVAFDIFLFAEADYKHKRTSLNTERETISKLFEVATGSKVVFSENVLPKDKRDWPSFDKSEGVAVFKDAASEGALAELAFAQAEYELAKGESWPDLKIGPVFQYAAEGGVSYPSFGVTIGFPLPLFSQNGGGRAFALKGVTKSEVSNGLLKTEKQAEYEILLITYENSLKDIRESLSVSEIDKKHRNIESLFSKGLIPAPSVIEAHRQILDFTKGKHEHEISALEALVKLYVLKGQTPEEVL